MKHAVLLATLIFAISAYADPVTRKGGDWRFIYSGVTPEPKTVEMCMAPTTPEQAIAKLLVGKTCSKKDIRYNGNVVTFDIACSDGTLQGTTKSTGDDILKTDFTLKGTESSAKSVHGTIDSKWLGACKPGETPH